MNSPKVPSEKIPWYPFLKNASSPFNTSFKESYLLGSPALVSFPSLNLKTVSVTISCTLYQVSDSTLSIFADAIIFYLPSIILLNCTTSFLSSNE
jgi:hypothetical protein